MACVDLNLSPSHSSEFPRRSSSRRGSQWAESRGLGITTAQPQLCSTALDHWKAKSLPRSLWAWDPRDREASNWAYSEVKAPFHRHRLQKTQEPQASRECRGQCGLWAVFVHICTQLAWSVLVKVSVSVMSDSATPWMVAHQAPLSMESLRQEYCSGLPFPSPGDLPHLVWEQPQARASHWEHTIQWTNNVLEEVSRRGPVESYKSHPHSLRAQGKAGFTSCPCFSLFLLLCPWSG